MASSDYRCECKTRCPTLADCHDPRPVPKQDRVCAYCESVEVANRGDYCSDDCKDAAEWEAAEDARADLEDRI